MKKWITFDLDGTLMQNPFGEWVFPEINRLLASQTGGRDVVKELVKENTRRMKAKQFPDAYDWDDILRKVTADLGVRCDSDVLQLVLKHSKPPKVFLLEDGLKAILEKLVERGYSLAVITNGFSAYQLPVLKVLGIDGMFQKLLTPDNTGYAKPDIKMAEPVLKDGVLTAHIGDRVDHDVYFANQLGCKSILIDRNMLEPLKQFSPCARVEDEAYIAVCRDKWEKRNIAIESTELVDPRMYIPSAALYSLEELEDLHLG